MRQQRPAHCSCVRYAFSRIRHAKTFSPIRKDHDGMEGKSGTAGKGESIRRKERRDCTGQEHVAKKQGAVRSGRSFLTRFVPRHHSPGRRRIGWKRAGGQQCCIGIPRPSIRPLGVGSQPCRWTMVAGARRRCRRSVSRLRWMSCSRGVSPCPSSVSEARQGAYIASISAAYKPISRRRATIPSIPLLHPRPSARWPT